MDRIVGYLSLKIGKISMTNEKATGIQVLSPSQDFQWNDELILESKCHRCGDKNPQKTCGCGIYTCMPTKDGLEELSYYAPSPDYIAFVGVTGGLTQVYQWGFRSAQWAIKGIVKWHPYDMSDHWKKYMIAALNYAKDMDIELAVYDLSAVQKAATAQKEYMTSLHSTIEELFKIKEVKDGSS